MDFNLPTGYSMAQLHAAQAQLRLDGRLICDLFDKTNIKYCLAFGSLLGAVRHGGFIPWDDDLDLLVYDEYYDQAMDLLRNKLPSNLIIHSIENDPNYYHCWNRVKNLNTSVSSAEFYHIDNKILKYKCLSIDLYRLPLMLFKDVEKYIEREAMVFWHKKHEAKLITDDENAIVPHYVRSYVATKMDGINSVGLAEDQLVRFFCMKMKKPVIAKYFDRLISTPFDDTSFLIPEFSDKVLDSMFDNYWELPNLQDRKTRLTSFLQKSDSYLYQ